MNGKEPKPKTWPDILDDTKEALEQNKINIAVQEAIIVEAKKHINNK